MSNYASYSCRLQYLIIDILLSYLGENVKDNRSYKKGNFEVKKWTTPKGRCTILP